MPRRRRRPMSIYETGYYVPRTNVPFKRRQFKKRQRRRRKAGCPLTVLTLALAAALVYVVARTI
jgi:hypothetical protein